MGQHAACFCRPAIHHTTTTPHHIPTPPARSFDEECRQVVRDNMEKRGIHLHFHTNPTK